MDYKIAAEELIKQFASSFKPAFLQRVDGITRGEMCILNYLVESKAPVLPKQISDTLGISTARVSAVLNSLESKGEAERSDDALDKRHTLVTITGKGKDYVYSRRREAIGKLASILEDMGDEEAGNFCRSIRLFCEASEKRINNI